MAEMNEKAILQIQDLDISFRTNAGVVNAIREKTVSFMEPIDARFERVKTAKVTIETTWRETR